MISAHLHHNAPVAVSDADCGIDSFDAGRERSEREAITSAYFFFSVVSVGVPSGSREREREERGRRRSTHLARGAQKKIVSGPAGWCRRREKEVDIFSCVRGGDLAVFWESERGVSDVVEFGRGEGEATERGGKRRRRGNGAAKMMYIV